MIEVYEDGEKIDDARVIVMDEDIGIFRGDVNQLILQMPTMVLTREDKQKVANDLKSFIETKSSVLLLPFGWKLLALISKPESE